MILNRRSHVLTLGLMAAVFFSLAANTLAFEDPTTGRWITRDPLGYNPPLVRLSVHPRPASNNGVLGLVSLRWLEGETIRPTYGSDGSRAPTRLIRRLFEVLASGPGNWRDPAGLLDCSHCWGACQSKAGQALAGEETAGFWICLCDGCRCACLNESKDFPWPDDPTASSAVKACVLAHEELHICDTARFPATAACVGRPEAGKPKRGGTPHGQSNRKRECRAANLEIRCLQEKRGECENDACRTSIDEWIESAGKQCRKLGGKVEDYPTTEQWQNPC